METMSPILNKEELQLAIYIGNQFEKNDAAIIAGEGQEDWCKSFINDDYVNQLEPKKYYVFKRTIYMHLHQQDLLNDGYEYSKNDYYTGILEK